MLEVVMQRGVVVGILAVALGACSGEKKTEVVAAAGSSAPKAAETPAEPAPPKQTEVMRAVADFDGDALVACAQATARFDATLKPTAVGTEGVLLLVEDGLVASRGGEAALADKGGKNELTKMLRVVMFELTVEQQSKLTADKQKQLTALRQEMTAGRSKAPEEFKEKGWVTVERCEFPNRTPLGICQVEDAGKDFGWTLAVDHFDVKSTSDTDAGMKNCLAIGGKWSVAEGGDAARERMKQHALELNKKMEKHSQRLNKQLEQLEGLADE